MIRSNEIVQLSASVYTCESVSDTIHQRNASGGFFTEITKSEKATTRFLSTYKRPARFFQQAHKVRFLAQSYLDEVEPPFTYGLLPVSSLQSRPRFHFLVFRGNDALTKTFALVSGPVDEHLRGDDVAEGHEHLHELGVTELLWQVVDEQVAALGS
ncbi:hypothetical protein HZH68_012198 [Vespula germanica]|uniref:Uncharacterized protein n=1 Tax=Vespula germanica TaxID=30212 RepID=A0A834JIK4_VESGE|nr:hypothetical protein HZH68_012198 [Vespula germanica]